MPEEEVYQTKIAKKLDELYRKWDETIEQSRGMMGLVYKMLRGEIPHLIEAVDQDPELREKIRKLVEEVSKVVEEDI